MDLVWNVPQRHGERQRNGQDKSTGKKQSTTIRSSGGLSDADVEETVQEFQEQLSNTDDRMAESIAELEDSAVKTTER